MDICQPNTVIWKAGETYTASCFLLPWSAVAPGDGWRVPGVDEASMPISWIDPTNPATRVNVALVIKTQQPTERGAQRPVTVPTSYGEARESG